MTNDNKNTFFRNVITGFSGQFIAIVLGLFVPRFFITSYGSDVNGLLGTITQIFTYLALLEAGIGQAARNALYKPFKDRNIGEISKISSSAREYFRKFTYIYGLGVIILAIVLPAVIKTDVDYLTVALIVLLEGLSGVISFYYIETPSIIIGIDGKSYVNNTITLLNRVVGYTVKIVMAALKLNIVVLQFAFFLVTIIKVLFYVAYYKKNYGWIQECESGGTYTLKDRNAYVLTEFAGTIFSSTDMIVLSMFVSTQMSSVYSIYNMVFTNINILVNAVYSSVVYLLGYAYHDSMDRYRKMHDAFNSIFMGIITILMTVSYVLILPFVKLYTNGVTDVDYVYTSLPILFCMIQLISWSRYVSGNLTGIAGYAKQTSCISLIEALTNLSLSIFFVNKFGILGVTLATVIALPLKVLWCTYISDKKVMKRSYWKSISIIGANFLFFFGVVLISRFYQPSINSYGQFFIWGIVLTVVFGMVGMTLNFIVNRDCWGIVRKYILKR